PRSGFLERIHQNGGRGWMEGILRLFDSDEPCRLLASEKLKCRHQRRQGSQSSIRHVPEKKFMQSERVSRHLFELERLEGTQCDSLNLFEALDNSPHVLSNPLQDLRLLVAKTCDYTRYIAPVPAQ